MSQDRSVARAPVLRLALSLCVAATLAAGLLSASACCECASGISVRVTRRIGPLTPDALRAVHVSACREERCSEARMAQDATEVRPGDDVCLPVNGEVNDSAWPAPEFSCSARRVDDEVELTVEIRDPDYGEPLKTACTSTSTPPSHRSRTAR